MSNTLMTTDFKSRAIIISLFLLFILALSPGTAGHADFDFWITWSIHNAKNGLKNTYLGPTDYLPGYQYILYLYGLLQGSEEAIRDHIKYLKFFTVLFDVLGVWYVYKWTDKRLDFLLLFFVCFFNPAFSFNGFFWGQVDAIPSALMFAAFYFIWRRNIISAMLFMVLALSFKLQAIIFLPLLGLLFLNYLIVEGNWKKFFIGLLSAAGLVLVILIPFIQTPESRAGLQNVIFGSIGKFGYVTWFAYNFWCYFVKDSTQIHDTEIFLGGLSYKSIGLILFCGSSFFALLPFLKTVFLNITRRQKQVISRERIWIAGALIPLLFFYFNTEMHERYSHPAFLFIIAYSVFRKDYFPMALMSIAYFLNMEDMLHWLRLNSYGTVIFEPAFVSSLYLVLIIYLFFRLYRIRPLDQGLSQPLVRHDSEVAYK